MSAKLRPNDVDLLVFGTWDTLTAEASQLVRAHYNPLGIDMHLEDFAYPLFITRHNEPVGVMRIIDAAATV